MKKIIAFLLVVMMVFSFAACSSEEKVTLIGTWESVDISGAKYTFNEDGSGKYTFMGTDMEFTYTDDGTQVTIQYSNSDAPNVFKYTIAEGKLNIEDSFGSIVVYEKQ